MARAKKHDHDGALTSYTAAIEAAGVPDDVKAMALYNRALIHVAVRDNSKGVADLEAILAMKEALAIENIKTMARQKLAKIESRTNKKQHPDR